MEWPKIALKSDGTLEEGMKVINKLVSLGASNTSDLIGHGKDYFYFIDYYGNIDIEAHLPVGYKLVALEQKQKLFKLI